MCTEYCRSLSAACLSFFFYFSDLVVFLSSSSVYYYLMMSCSLKLSRVNRCFFILYGLRLVMISSKDFYFFDARLCTRTSDSTAQHLTNQRFFALIQYAVLSSSIFNHFSFTVSNSPINNKKNAIYVFYDLALSIPYTVT